jgi:hypothetical protein
LLALVALALAGCGHASVGPGALTVRATAYSWREPAHRKWGKKNAIGGSQARPLEGMSHCAVDPDVIPLGSILDVPGIGELRDDLCRKGDKLVGLFLFHLEILGLILRPYVVIGVRVEDYNRLAGRSVNRVTVVGVDGDRRGAVGEIAAHHLVVEHGGVLGGAVESLGEVVTFCLKVDVEAHVDAEQGVSRFHLLQLGDVIGR